MGKPTKPRPWVVDEGDRKGPQGRPRSGPGERAVRELPRATVRALGRSLALWEAILREQSMQSHDAFEKVLAAYLDTLPADTRNAIERRAKTLRRERFRGVP
jgi:hypothetical protein